MDAISIAVALFIVLGLAVGTLRRLYYHQLIVVLVLAVFALQFLTAPIRGNLISSVITIDLAFISVFPPPTSDAYRIFTSMFLHANFLHVMVNMIALLLIGSMLETRIRSRRFIVLYFATGVLGALVFLLANYNDFALLVGASGGISGLLGALGRLYPYERILMFYGFIPIPTPAWIAVILFLFIQVFISFTYLSVAWQAHLGGALAGYFLAPHIMRMPSGGPGEARPTVDATALKDLATTLRTKEILSRIADETDGEIQRAWMEKFAGQARCPECDGRLELKRRSLVSDCGWSRRY